MRSAMLCGSAEACDGDAAGKPCAARARSAMLGAGVDPEIAATTAAC